MSGLITVGWIKVGMLAFNWIEQTLCTFCPRSIKIRDGTHDDHFTSHHHHGNHTAVIHRWQKQKSIRTGLEPAIFGD